MSIQFILLMLTILSIGNAAPQYSVRQSHQIRVMNYNIFQMGWQNGNWDETQRLQHLKDTLSKLSDQPDVIVFNEVFRDQAVTTIKQMANLYPHQTGVVGHSCEAKGNWHTTSGDCSNSIAVIRGGVMVISKFPIKNKHQLVFETSHKKSWDYLSNKGAVYVNIKKEGRHYHVVGTHLQAEEGSANHKVRMAQLREINSWLRHFNIPKAEPVILAGDLNVEFSNKREIKDMVANSNAKLLPMSSKNKVDSFSAPTNWLSKSQAYIGNKSPMSYSQTLDYLLIYKGHLQAKSTTGIEIVKIKTAKKMYWRYLRGYWPDDHGRKTWHDGYYGDLSDHYPVVSTFHF